MSWYLAAGLGAGAAGLFCLHLYRVYGAELSDETLAQVGKILLKLMHLLSY